MRLHALALGGDPSPVRGIVTCYCMSMLDRRLQILVDEGRFRRLEQVAKRRRVSVSTVVRDAIDRELGSIDDVRRRHAGRRFLDGPEMEVPDVDELLAELDAIRGRRG